MVESNPTDVIPSGDYCYEILEIIHDDNKMPVIKTKLCPYFGRTYDIESEEMIAFCAFVNKSDSCLLDDQCKICGVNNENASK